MSKFQTERLIQTAQHSNPQVVIMGTVADASGEVTIDWLTSHHVVFITLPIILAIYPEGVPTSEPYQPVCYHQEWIKDGETYTGMKVFSNGLGTAIHWAVQGIVKK
jgi:hypothetical protein